ncbi:unnamed protein product [Rotaria socialis]|uniref:Uncharacterized protein n=1 Tax=Rotaria socialis TaxID=392032 RepID=A0A820XM47_9BILA|nr:unnamed protein product [Rotaria socialis]CAF3292409.1 unnamed protein product [Rotaria socialis]CAF3371848.1 unnamed protein product [Rotaria socialis]CAF3641816.1 unnamed protein product [Rotaria socialis]CAF4534589.1 unnamed protein product [Rotaria socialis]
MISKIFSVVLGLFIVSIVSIVQLAPVKSISDGILSSQKTAERSAKLIQPSIISASQTSTGSPVSANTTTVAHGINDIKKKRQIDNYERLGDFLDDENTPEDLFYPKIKQWPKKIYDNRDKSVDTDKTNAFTDIIMNPDEYINLARKRRSINLNSASNQRNKRSLSLYNLYNTDPLYEALVERQQYASPGRAYAVYPPTYERNVRADFAPYFYDSPQWNSAYANAIENNENQSPFSLSDDDDGDDDGYLRFPVLPEANYMPFDNLQLQKAYQYDNAPIDEVNNDDDDEESVYMPYERIESLFQ